ncbi:kinase-like domain-containing protein [Chlamydoabsidia padenii]|nr:kinase-like domain-containing protein [Chlamydoabsidia padenii]
MDYCTMGDLSQYIKRIRSAKATRGPLGGLPENTVRHFLQQLASALRFLRSQNLVHRDIKPQNLLLVSPRQHQLAELPTLQVADFGFARFLPNASLADTLCGSPLYMGPEILSYKKYDAKTDLWSVGAVLYEMMTGRPPFRAQNHLELLKKIQENNDVIQFADEKVPDIPSMMGDDLKDLVRKLLKKDPVERIPFEEFFVHPAILRSTNPLPIPSHSTTSNVTRTSISSTSSSSHPTNATTHTPPRSIIKRQDEQSDLPPFAQTTTTTTTTSPYQGHHRMSTALSSSPVRQTYSRYHSRDSNPSPINSRGRSAKTVEFNNDLHESGMAVIKRTSPWSEEEILQGYVFVDRRTIEANQFADEMNASPHNNDGDRYSIQGGNVIGQVAIPRRKSSSSSLSTATTSSTSPNTPPFVMSRERRISSGGVTAGSALVKAISMAGERLFGTGKSPPDYHRPQRTMAGTPRGFLTLMMKTGKQDIQATDTDNDDGTTIDMIEKMACMGHTVARFADTKYEHLINGHKGIGVASETTLAAEALALHLKSLALLDLGFEMARTYWHRQKSVDSQPSQYSAIRLNDAVQWMRERFNDCLDRASFEKSRCETNDDSSGGNNTCVEKLLYDKALEMSRAAAVNELVGENLAECEQDYQTAIWMLEAIMEVGEDKDVAIEEDDRKIINKFIDSIQQRLYILRKKIMNQQEPQGSSTTTTHMNHGSDHTPLVGDR